MDASPTMLALAQENLTRRCLTGWELAGSPAELLDVAPEYDLLHSVLVFQHIRPAEGYRAFGELLTGLAQGGCGGMQFVVRLSSDLRELARSMRARWHLLGRADAALRRRPAEAALIEVHGYDLGGLLEILAEAESGEVATSSVVGDRLDVTLYFRRP